MIFGDQNDPKDPNAGTTPNDASSNDTSTGNDTSAAASGNDTPAVGSEDSPSGPKIVSEGDAPAGNVVSITMKGNMHKVLQVEVGTTLKAALTAAGYAPDAYTYREGSTSKPVSLDRKLNDNFEITAVKKAAGG